MADLSVMNVLNPKETTMVDICQYMPEKIKILEVLNHYDSSFSYVLNYIRKYFIMFNIGDKQFSYNCKELHELLKYVWETTAPLITFKTRKYIKSDTFLILDKHFWMLYENKYGEVFDLGNNDDTPNVVSTVEFPEDIGQVLYLPHQTMHYTNESIIALIEEKYVPTDNVYSLGDCTFEIVEIPDVVAISVTTVWDKFGTRMNYNFAVSL